MFLNRSQPQGAINTALKVKMFISPALDSVEKEVNEWLAGEPVRVSHVTQSQSEKQGRFVFVTSVFYVAAASG